jgi:chaperonin GroES
VKIEPLANRVVFTMIEESKLTKGKLWVPDIAHKNRGIAYGEVIAVGPGRNAPDGRLVPCHLKVGDVIMFPRVAPAVLTIEDDDGNELEVLMCPENDVIAKVTGLKRQSSLVGIDGAALSIEPQSLALPDGVYANREGIDRSISDLKQSKAPPDVIAELTAEGTDGPQEIAGE